MLPLQWTYNYLPKANLYSRTSKERPAHWPQKCGLSIQVVSVIGSDILKYKSFCQKCVSVKTGGLSLQWSLKTSFTVKPITASTMWGAHSQILQDTVGKK